MNQVKQTPKILISHRVADRSIAEVIRRNLKQWGFDDIHQAGAPEARPQVGEFLPVERPEAFDDVDLVILVYTFADEDWSWCMWACGLATQPQEPDATRVVVFRCSTYDAPRQFAQQMMVDVDPEGIHKFTKQVHRTDDFLGAWPAFRRRISDMTLENLSEYFYEELKPVIPIGQREERIPTDQREERYLWDSFTLKLEPPVDQFNFETNEDELCEQIQSELVVTQQFGNALRHFGYANLEGGLKLSDLVGRWTQETQDRENVSNTWIKGLCLEIRRAIDAYPAEPSWQQLNSVYFNRTSYYPVLNHMRVLPDGSTEFDVYFYTANTNQRT